MVGCSAMVALAQLGWDRSLRGNSIPVKLSVQKRAGRRAGRMHRKKHFLHKKHHVFITSKLLHSIKKSSSPKC